MKKKKFTLRTPTDIKIFLLFLLDQIRYPIDRTTLIEIITENTEEIIIDYDECLGELSDSEHIWFDEIDGEKYYMISDSGKMVAKELFETLDKDFREKSISVALKHLSLSKSGARIKSEITETEGGKYKIRMNITDEVGELLDVSITVATRSEAEKIKKKFQTRPESVYRGILFSVTERKEYFNNSVF